MCQILNESSAKYPFYSNADPYLDPGSTLFKNWIRIRAMNISLRFTDLFNNRTILSNFSSITLISMLKLTFYKKNFLSYFSTVKICALRTKCCPSTVDNVAHLEVTLTGGCRVTWAIRKFIARSSQFIRSSTISLGSIECGIISIIICQAN